MTRLVFLAAGPLLLALCLCQLETAEAIPQMSPEVKKISILDLFQEVPSLKSELEARLIEKGKKPASISGGGTPRETKAEAPPATTTTTTSTTTTTTTTTEAPEASSTTAASEDKQSPRALRSRGRPSRTSGPESAVAAADDTEPAATEDGATTTTTTDAEAPGAAGGPARKLRPQRLTLRRQRPGQAVAASTTTGGSAAGDLPEPELEETLVKTLVEGSEAEGGPEAKEEVEAEPAVPTKKPRARFSLPPRNGAATGGSAPANKKVEEAAPAEEKAGSGLDRLRNARIGGGRFRNSGGRQAPAAAAAADEASPAATADDASAKPLSRLSLAERRSRFSNARTPPTAAAAEEEAAPQEEETAAVTDEAAAGEESPAGAPRRNARRFPPLARRNS